MAYRSFRKILFVFLFSQLLFATHALADNTFGGQLFDMDFQEQNIESFGLDQTHTVALTFDDGPGAGTEQILDTLKQYHIKASFFLLGQQIKTHPALVKRMVEEGHVIGNHSYTHPDLRQGKYVDHPELLLQELVSTHELLLPYLKPNAKLFFRAPYAAWRPENAGILNADPELRKYIGPVCWDVGRDVEWDQTEYTNAADWECWGHKNPLSEKACSDGYLHKLHELGGGVVLMHDIHLQTAKMVALLIPQLVAEGYKFKTLEEIPEFDRYSAGSGALVPRDNPPDSQLSPYQRRCLPLPRRGSVKYHKPLET